MDDLANAKVQQDLATIRPFRANPYHLPNRPPGAAFSTVPRGQSAPRSRSRSPGHDQSGFYGQDGKFYSGTGNRSPNAVRTGGGFLLFHPDSSW